MADKANPSKDKDMYGKVLRKEDKTWLEPEYVDGLIKETHGHFGKQDAKDIVDAKGPLVPDPFWPDGAAPTHLSKERQNDIAVGKAFREMRGPVWRCEKCGAESGRSLKNDKLCHTCYDKESQNTALARKVNANWMDEAAALGLALFERQPEETDTEWLIWCTYRSYYPLKLPTWSELARKCGHAVATVTKAAQKWSFKVRLIAWARHTDDTVQERRIAAIKEMNEKQLGMAKTIQDKLQDAISTLNPQLLKPNEIVSLFKVATELERKVTTYVDEKVENTVTESTNKQTIMTKPEDLGEVVSILNKLGVLQGKSVGIEQTTRIIAKGDENA